MRKGSSKIREDLWEKVYTWHVQGMSSKSIADKLLLEHGISVNMKAVDALLRNIRKAKDEQTKSVLSERIVNSIEQDYKALERIEKGLDRVARSAEKNENDGLYLRTVDRQLKFYQLKLAIASDRVKEGPSKETLLEALLEKGGRQ